MVWINVDIFTSGLHTGETSVAESKRNTDAAQKGATFTVWIETVLEQTVIIWRRCDNKKTANRNKTAIFVHHI